LEFFLVYFILVSCGTEPQKLFLTLQIISFKVNNEVMKKYGEEEVQTGSGRTREKAVQLSELRSYLRKKVMFFPGAGN